MNRNKLWLRGALALWFFAAWSAEAGFYTNTLSPGNVPWPGGVVPYVIDPALSPAQQQTYLNGLREYELVANVHFIPRTSEPQYILFKYSPNGPNLVSGSNPQLVEINLLTRGQISHEMGHSFGLQHEHTRQDRNGFVTVLSGNITAGNEHFFNIDPNATAHAAYDFESVMHFGRDLFSVQPGILDTLQAKPGFEKFQPRMGGPVLSKGDRAVMKFLYGAGPTLSSVVTNTSETGVGSLRAAMHYVSDNPGTPITFNIPTSDPNYANGVFTIRPTGYLAPFVIDGAIIDATTQPGYAGSPLIVLEGTQILPVLGDVPGLLVYAANCTVKGLSFQRFPWVGLALLYADAHHNNIRSCWFGLDSAGTASAPNVKQGVYIFSGSYSNTVGGTTAADRNVLSGNGEYGIWISGATTTGNIVSGNYIGTSGNGLAAVPNGSGGLIITDNSKQNTIGGTLAGARNVISGNTNAGIWITGLGVDANAVRGNYIGLAASGTAAVPNTFAGLYILNGAKNNLVADNVISGNINEGMRIADPGTSGNVVQGNRVGLAATGSSAIGNGFAGVAVYAGATGNTVGGTTAAARNIISGNGTVGLVFGEFGTKNNVAYGNFIGTDAAGTASVPNGFAGAYLVGAAEDNQLGGLPPGSGNLISGNTGYGVFIGDSGTEGNLVRGNFIGTNASGTAALPNSFAGIAIFGGAQSNVIGDTAGGGRNVISGNSDAGITIAGSESDSNIIRGNTIGMNASASAAIPNSDGISFFDGASSNLIGGTGLGASNLIAGNTSSGLFLSDAGTVANVISGNSIFDNGGAGISLFNGANNEQPAPALTSATLDTATRILGSFTIGASGTYRIEFFSSPAADPSGFGEGRNFIGSLNVTASGGFSAVLPAIVPAGQVVTASVTDPVGNTSAFSNAVTVAFTSPDADGDGIPTEYENANGLNTGVNDAGLDKDGDGLTNEAEFRAGTNPQSAASRFRVSAVTKNASGFDLSFASIPGKTYRVEKKDSLLAPNWILLSDQIFATGTSISITDPAVNLSQRYYRVALEP